MSKYKIILSADILYNGCPKSHFTLLKANKTEPNIAKKIGYVSNKRPNLGVFLLMKNSFIV